jgi:hypothetical protein
MKTLAVVALVATLAACTSTPKNWYKEGASEKDFSAATDRCRAQSVAGTAQNVSTYTDCMNGQGWFMR